jgi:hypothetical protein
VKVRKLFPLTAAALGVWVGGSAVAADKAKPTAAKPAKTSTAMPAAKPVKPATATPADNQRLADAIVARLTATGSVAGADLSFHTEAGVVTVTGMCRDAAHKQAIMQDVRVVPGVKMVRDGVKVGGVMQAQATVPMGPLANMPPVGVPPGAVGPAVEPAPLGHPGMGPADGFAPPLPPHAWPTYAPYNNASRIGYPQAYPYNAFPFIGPFYPFPKVPLGWRSVSLEWEDGHWWLGRKSAPYDYWRVRFW